MHDLPKLCGNANDLPDDIHPIGRNRAGALTHRRPPKKDGQDLPDPPERDITDFHLRGRGFPMVANSGKGEIELLAPRIDRRRHGKRRIDLVRRLGLTELRLQPNAPDGNADSFCRHSHRIHRQIAPDSTLQLFLMPRTLACLLREIKATILRDAHFQFHLLARRRSSHGTPLVAGRCTELEPVPRSSCNPRTLDGSETLV